MSKPDRVSMTDMRMPLPSAPVLIRADDTETQPVPVDVPISGIYTPASKSRDVLVTWSCRIPLRIRTMLEETAADYNTDMTKIVVDLLEMHLPNIPKRKR